MNLNLADQTILITGSTRGIGKAIAIAFLEEHAKVVLTGRNEEKLKDTVQSFKKNYGINRIFAFKGDLGSTSTIHSLHNYISKQTKGLNHLICNIGSGKSVPPLHEDITEFRRMFDINLFIAVAVIQKMIPLLEISASKKNTSASITLIGSICGVESLGCPVAYASAKAALESYVKNIARPLGRKNIRVNIVSPGNIYFRGSTWEEKFLHDKFAVQEMLDREVPLNRFGTLEEVANIVTFLSSKHAGFVTGANWIVDGGQTR